MSYDLFFTSDESSPTKDDFLEYFSNRKNYTLEGSQAWYENEDTDVYFSFHFNDEDENVEDDEIDYWSSFNMNLARPHFFCWEAIPELEAFTEFFGVTVHDPQFDGMETGKFKADDFARGWNTANKSGYLVISSNKVDEPFDEPMVFPSERLEAIWSWNYNRNDFQEEVGESIFVPKIMIMKYEQQIYTAAVWIDACPIYLPTTDVLIILRDELSNNPGQEEICVVNTEDFADMLMDLPLNHRSMHYTPIEPDTLSSEIVEFIKDMPVSDIEFETIACDQVLDEQILRQAMQRVA